MPIPRRRWQWNLSLLCESIRLGPMSLSSPPSSSSTKKKKEPYIFNEVKKKKKKLETIGQRTIINVQQTLLDLMGVNR
jgi:hypothetical protein